MQIGLAPAGLLERKTARAEAHLSSVNQPQRDWPQASLGVSRLGVRSYPVYASSQLGHEDPTFTLTVYAQVVRHRERLTAKERQAFERAVEWARMGTEPLAVSETVKAPVSAQEETRRFERVS